jgi:hypothetical protein
MEMTRRRFLSLTGTGGIIAGTSLLGGLAFSRARAEAPNDVRIGSVTWLASVEEAKARASRERKPILLLSLFGRLDHDFC